MNQTAAASTDIPVIDKAQIEAWVADPGNNFGNILTAGLHNKELAEDAIAALGQIFYTPGKGNEPRPLAYPCKVGLLNFARTYPDQTEQIVKILFDLGNRTNYCGYVIDALTELGQSENPEIHRLAIDTLKQLWMKTDTASPRNHINIIGRTNPPAAIYALETLRDIGLYQRDFHETDDNKDEGKFLLHVASEREVTARQIVEIAQESPADYGRDAIAALARLYPVMEPGQAVSAILSVAGKDKSLTGFALQTLRHIGKPDAMTGIVKLGLDNHLADLSYSHMALVTLSGMVEDINYGAKFDTAALQVAIINLSDDIRRTIGYGHHGNNAWDEDPIPNLILASFAGTFKKLDSAGIMSEPLTPLFEASVRYREEGLDLHQRLEAEQERALASAALESGAPGPG